MDGKTVQVLKRYGVAVGLPLLALVVRAVLPFPEGAGIYQLPLAAVVLSAWYGGRGPGWLATAIAFAGAMYLVPPAGSFAVHAEHALPLSIFAALCLLLTEFGAGRRRAEQALRESEARFRRLTELSAEGHWKQDENLRFIHSMDERHGFENRSLGKTRWELPFTPLSASWDEHRADLIARKPFHGFEYSRVHPDGTIRYISVSGVPVFDDQGAFKGYDGVASDITAGKLAEAERQAHMWFLESMDRVHRAMQGTEDSQKMMNNVLGEVLDIFQCERVILSVFGTRSGTAWYKRLAIKLHPGHDHRDKVGIEYVADKDSHAMRMEVRAAGRPVPLVLGSVPPHVARVHAHFRTQSVLSMSIEAKQERHEYDHFYYFSLDQCSYARVWTADDMRLFEEIGRRLGDALIKLSALADLQRRDAYLSAAQRLSHTASWAWNAARRDFVHWSGGWLPLQGPEPAPDFPTLDTVRQSIHPEDRAAWSERFERSLRERSELDVEYRSVQADGTIRHIRTVAHPVLDGSGELVEFVGTDIDITEHRAHLWFLESMDRINRAMHGTNDLEKMMGDVLDAVLEIFQSDRAWLLYPCDPDAPSWRPVMERTSPRFPGAAARGRDLAMTPNSAEVARAALGSRGALPAGPGHERQVKPEIAEHFGVQSEMLMALWPKSDQAYLFGLHQCARPRSWTNEEQRLFEEIGHRLTDALTSLIAFRSLRESEARLEAAQRVAHIGWWERDYATGHVSLSDEACRIFGVQPLDLPHWHGRWLSLIHPDDRPKTAEASEKALRGDARYDVEYRVVRPDGAVRVVHSQGDVTRDESGRAVRQFGVLQDITELRQTERRLEAAQRIAHVGWWERDYVGGRMLVSEEVAQIYDIADQPRVIELAEWMKLLPTIIHAQDYPRVLAASEAALRGGPRYDMEYRVVHRDGTVRIVHSQADVIRDQSGRHVRQFGVAQDITELRQAEQDMRASEARFRTFVDHATDAFFLHDEKLALVDVNRQACESLGYSREELIGMHPSNFDVGLTGAAIAQLSARVAAGETVSFETLHRRKDGIVFPVEVSARAFLQGERRFHLSFVRDISERKLVEETLKGKDAALHMARTELARVSRLTTLGELTASIAHEVNQPLGAMVTNAAACARWLAAKPADMKEARAALDNIVSDGKRAGEIIKRIRGLTKRQMPRMEPLDVNRKIADVVALADHELKSQEIVLRTQLDRTLPPVAGDRVQLQQVLLNLILNAMEAMSSVHDRARELTIVSRRSDGNAAMVEVSDSGPGLDGQAAERLFEAFYTTKPEGIGIGLSISRSIVEAHGGRMWANPNHPHGAVFHFTLPLASEAQSQS